MMMMMDEMGQLLTDRHSENFNTYTYIIHVLTAIDKDSDDDKCCVYLEHAAAGNCFCEEGCSPTGWACQVWRGTQQHKREALGTVKEPAARNWMMLLTQVCNHVDVHHLQV